MTMARAGSGTPNSRTFLDLKRQTMEYFKLAAEFSSTTVHLLSASDMTAFIED